MTQPDEYKSTLFDRHGPAAQDYLRAWAYGLMIFGLVFGVVTARIGFSLWTIPIAATAGAFGGGFGFLIGKLVGDTWKAVAVDGSSTPYREQYSYQQALVMRGQIDEALESYEAVIAEQPLAADVRVKAAELYWRERKNAKRAADLFRQVQRIAAATPGEVIYATHRLVDLLTGPLEDPGRALVELRWLIERYPATPAAEQARVALAELKGRVKLEG